MSTLVDLSTAISGGPVTLLGSGIAYIGYAIFSGRETMASIWTKTREFFGKTWVFITTLVSVVVLIIERAVQTVTDLLSMISNLVVPAGSALSGKIAGAVSLANMFIPITEATQFIVAYYLLYVGIAAYRFIKSFVPSVAS